MWVKLFSNLKVQCRVQTKQNFEGSLLQKGRNCIKKASTTIIWAPISPQETASYPKSSGGENRGQSIRTQLQRQLEESQKQMREGVETRG